MGKSKIGCTVPGRLWPTTSSCWPSPPPRRPGCPSRAVHARATLGASHRASGGGGTVHAASSVYAVPRGLRREHERPRGSTPSKVWHSKGHLSGLDARRSNVVVRFQGGGESPVNGGDFSVFLHRSGPSRDVMLRLNQSKTHLRVALTGRGW
jgi:hypothetical protein